MYLGNIVIRGVPVAQVATFKNNPAAQTRAA
jgi:hypothetical protein